MSPAAIRQAYLTGQDDNVIVDLVPDQFAELEDLRQQLADLQGERR